MGKAFELEKPVIGKILTGQKPYVVPPYQRDYSWDKDEVESFWKDLIGCIGDKSYFLGSMVFKTEDGEDEITVIDGQQRLATTTILLSAIRDLLFELDAEKDSWSIGFHYIIKEYEGQTEVKALTLNIQNREFFYYCIQLPPDDKNRKKFTDYPKLQKTNKLLKNAYEYFKTELLNSISSKSPKEKIQFLNDLVKHIRTTLMVITITVDSEDEAYLIFETINDRGLGLSVADLFKNYLIREAKTERDKQEIISVWKEISDLLDEKLRAFLRHYWVSKNSLITERKLFAELKNHIKESKIDVKDFVSDLKDEATNYNLLLNPENGSWQDKEIAPLIADFNVLSAKQCLPLLLCGLKMFDEKEFKNLLNSVINFTFRYSTICNKHNNILETRYSETAMQIRDGKIKDTQQAMKNLKSIYPEENEFNSSFMKKKFEGKLARYVLAKIDKKHGTYPEKIDYGSLTLEHILPKKPDKEWQEVLKNYPSDDIGSMIHWLGNLTLLDISMNNKAQNSIFTNKRDEYFKNSGLWLNKSLADEEQWSPEEIFYRQENLSSLANGIWKIDF